MSESRPFDPELRRELLDRRDHDQDARHAYAAAERGERDWSPVDAIDADNLDFLAPLLDRHGWLGSDLVDVDGAHACWLLVQHAPPGRQDAWLPLMERAVADGTASARDLAYLRDRVNMHHNRPQIHGTQHAGYGGGRVRLWPVTDPDTLNERRDTIGLPPVDAATIADAWTPAELAQHGHHLTDT